MLVVQYGLGIVVNLYVTVPATDQHDGIVQALGRALSSRPLVLASHAVLGLLMLVAGISVLVRAVIARHLPSIAASTIGYIAIIGAAISGAELVDQGHQRSSLVMALLTGVALLCYLINLFLVGRITEQPRSMRS